MLMLLVLRIKVDNDGNGDVPTSSSIVNGVSIIILCVLKERVLIKLLQTGVVVIKRIRCLRKLLKSFVKTSV